MRDSRWTLVAQSVGAAAVAYLVAGTTETILIGILRPTEWELTWISDVIQAVALGIAVYLWRHLQASRQELAARERAELVLRTQLSVAAEIQRRLLPDLPSGANGVEWAASLHSAGRIGGDFYDIVELARDRWLLLVADVSGKGIPAAMALGSLRAAFRTVAREHHDRPAQALSLLSAALYEEWRGDPYVTGIVARIDMADGSLTCASAGHPPGIVVGRAGVRLLSASGPPAGLLSDVAYDEQSVPLERGDCCVFVTDGVTEALDGGQSSPLEQIVAVATRQPGPAQATCDALMTSALAGHGPDGVADWDDDRTVVVVAVRGETDVANRARAT